MVNEVLKNILGEAGGPNGALVFKELFKDWTCPAWIARDRIDQVRRERNMGNVREMRRNDLNAYFYKLRDAHYLDSIYMQKTNRNGNSRHGTFFRANLNAFYAWCKEKDIEFGEKEKKLLEFYFDLPGNRNVGDGVNTIKEFINDKVIELTLGACETLITGSKYLTDIIKQKMDESELSRMVTLIDNKDVQRFVDFVGKWKDFTRNDFLVYYAKRKRLNLFKKTYTLIPKVYRDLFDKTK